MTSTSFCDFLTPSPPLSAIFMYCLSTNFGSFWHPSPLPSVRTSFLEVPNSAFSFHLGICKWCGPTPSHRTRLSRSWSFCTSIPSCECCTWRSERGGRPEICRITGNSVRRAACPRSRCSPRCRDSGCFCRRSGRRCSLQKEHASIFSHYQTMCRLGICVVRVSDFTCRPKHSEG